MLLLFLLGGYISRVYYGAVDSPLLQLIMNPKAAITGLVDRMIFTTRKVAFQIVYQLVWLRRLGKGFKFTITRKHTHTPAFLVDIQTDVNRLTGAIKFAILNLIHGKPPFGIWCLVVQPLYPKP
jgi:hypothetical protein